MILKFFFLYICTLGFAKDLACQSTVKRREKKNDNMYKFKDLAGQFCLKKQLTPYIGTPRSIFR